MLTMRVDFPSGWEPKATSPVKVTVDGRTYAVTFSSYDRSALVPYPIGYVLVMTGIARDRGPVTGLDEWPRVTPEWRM